MKKRDIKARHEALLSLVAQHQQCSVEQLSNALHISAVTVRKDLAMLEEQGKLLRRFGGAQALTPVHQGFKVSNRKNILAHGAQHLIAPQHRIVIDSGSTTAALVPYLAKQPQLVVMTNSLSVGQQLSQTENGPTLLMTGGTWDSHSHSFQGLMAEQMLRQYNFDQAFIGATGLDPVRGTTTYNELTHLTQVMADVADQVVVMAESSKLQLKIPNLELAWDKIDILVTDDLIDTQSKQHIEQQGVKVICAATQNEE